MTVENKQIMEERKKPFSLPIIDKKVLIFSLVVNALFFLFASDLFDYVFFEKHDENFKSLLSGFLAIDAVASSLYSLTVLYSIVLIIYISVQHINDKKRKYIYYVGRKTKFFKKYLVELFKRASKVFLSYYFGFLIVILVAFFVNVFFLSSEMQENLSSITKDINIFNFGSRMILPSNDEIETFGIARKLYEYPNLLFMVVLWIPVYFAIVTYSFIVVLVNELTRNIIVTTLGMICFYFFLNPLLKALNLELFEPVIFGTFIAKGLLPMQYLFITGLVNLIIILLLNGLRRALKVSEI